MGFSARNPPKTVNIYCILYAYCVYQKKKPTGSIEKTRYKWKRFELKNALSGNPVSPFCTDTLPDYFPKTGQNRGKKRKNRNSPTKRKTFLAEFLIFWMKPLDKWKRIRYNKSRLEVSMASVGCHALRKQLFHRFRFPGKPAEKPEKQDEVKCVWTVGCEPEKTNNCNLCKKLQCLRKNIHKIYHERKSSWKRKS